MASPVQFTQLQTAILTSGVQVIVALDMQGQIWIYNSGTAAWTLLTPPSD